ncbi:HD domain-containing protein [bacterium]|nr:HD domain-containing protein [bacterium]
MNKNFGRPDITFDRQVEKAIKFLVLAMMKSSNNPKPIILHSLKVGFYLYNMGCDQETVIGGFLHDLLEDSATTAEEIEQIFGKRIADLVQANTFAKRGKSEEIKYKDCFSRCVKEGKPALLIKAADILDNSFYYPLAENKQVFQRLLQKMDYFIKLSKPYLKDEIVWKELVKRFRFLSLSLDGSAAVNV